jgi:hypothetical protein
MFVFGYRSAPGTRRARRLRPTLSAMLATTTIFAITMGLGRPAAADWAYTKWGMTPEQVVAASNGTAHVLPADKRTRNDADKWEIAADGNYKDGDLPLSTGFMFDLKSGGLICVVYNATGKPSEALEAKLTQRYGSPAEQSDIFTMKTIHWTKPDDVELTVDVKRLTAAVMHCQAGR